MALDFPNPATQTPVNEFSPTSTPSATTNGVTYTWDGTKWVGAAGQGTGADLQSVTDNGNTTTNGIEIGGGDITLNADGSGTFASNIEIGGGNISLGADGAVTFHRDGNRVINTSSSATSLTVQGGAGNPGGRIDFNGGTGPNNLGFFTTDNPGGSVSIERMRLNADGNLNIAGDLTDNGSNISFNNSGSARFSGTVDAPNVFFILEPDNEANYTATTDAEGNENRVYNGPTLDVKESIQEAVAARAAMRETFQELQVAVEAATDFASLKAAMLGALEDYAA